MASRSQQVTRCSAVVLHFNEIRWNERFHVGGVERIVFEKSNDVSMTHGKFLAKLSIFYLS